MHDEINIISLLQMNCFTPKLIASYRSFVRISRANPLKTELFCVFVSRIRKSLATQRITELREELLDEQRALVRGVNNKIFAACD